MPRKTDITAETPLSRKEELFCNHYALTLNATYSAIQAGYNPKSAGVVGCALLKRVNVAARIDYFNKNVAEQLGITKQFILKEHLKLATSNPKKLQTGWMDLKEFDKLTEDDLSVVQEVKVKTTKYGTNIYIKVYDKQRSLDSIANLLGFNNPEIIREPVKINISIEDMSE
jgi:phage terminase small subunit